MELEFNISGIHCQGCVNLVALTMEDYGFRNIKIDTVSGAGTAETEISDFSEAEKKLVEAFKSLTGYKLVSIKKKS